MRKGWGEEKPASRTQPGSRDFECQEEEGEVLGKVMANSLRRYQPHQVQRVSRFIRDLSPVPLGEFPDAPVSDDPTGGGESVKPDWDPVVGFSGKSAAPGGMQARMGLGKPLRER